MKAAVLGFLTLSFALSAQSVAGRDAPAGVQALKSDLQSLRTGAPSAQPLTGQVAAHMLLLADKSHEPKPATLQQFAANLVGALAGHSAAQEDLDRLAGDIQQTLESASTSTVGFEDTIKDFEKRLMRAGVPAVRSHLVASNLERIGREVRGPEDTPVR